MKTYHFTLLLLFTVILYSCKKDNPTAVIPPAADSLGVWEKINTGASSGFDVWFTDAKNGCLINGNGGIYTSNDSGKTWQQRATGMDNYNLFFYNSLYGYDMGVNGQTAVTTDGGITWTKKGSYTGAPGNIFFVSPSTGFITSGTGLFKTTDTCNTWVHLYSGNIISIFFFNPAKGYMTFKTGDNDSLAILNTIDSGANWNLSGTYPCTDNPSSSLNVLQFTDSATAYFSFANKIYKTIDTGHTIIPISLPVVRIVDINFFDNHTGYVMTGDRIYYTNNGGVSFTASCALGNDPFNGMYFLNANNGWAVSSDGYVLRYKQ